LQGRSKKVGEDAEIKARKLYPGTLRRAESLINRRAGVNRKNKAAKTKGKAKESASVLRGSKGLGKG